MTRYLISAHLAAGQTYVIDLRTNAVVATVTDTPGAEGVEYVPELKKFYTSNAGDNTIGVVDLKQMKVVKKIPTEAKPDGSAYAAPFHKLYVSDERGKAEAIVDVRTDAIVKTLHFESETGHAAVRSGGAQGLCQPAGPERASRSSIRRPTTVVGRYPVGRCKGNHGMALDPEHHRAFLSCEGNDLMTVFNLDTHEPIAFLPTRRRSGCHQVRSGLSRIYVACSSGAISDLSDGRSRSRPQAGGFPRAEARPQPGGRSGDAPRVRTGTGARRRSRSRA